MAKERLIVGLGNPGREYQYTRHNLGSLVIQRLAEIQKIDFKRSSFSESAVAEFKSDGERVFLLLPLTYMNHCGRAIKPFLKARDIDPQQMLVVTDDLHLSFGQVRIRAKGTDGGHNGLTSIIDSIQTQNFPRLRLGIGKPKSADQTVDFVLDKFTKIEHKQLDSFIQDAADCCQVWLKEGINKAMEKFNQRKENE